MIRSSACVLLIATSGVAFPSVCCAQAPTLAGKSSAYWAKQLVDDREQTIVKLAELQPASLGVLAELLDDDKENVVQATARACERIGPDAAPLREPLVRGLRSASSWWTQMNCGNALAAICAGDQEVIEALMVHVRQSDVPRLRAECAQAVAKLGGNIGKRIPAAVEAGDMESERAGELLRWLGDPVIEQLFEAVDADSKSGRVAHDALTRIGWRVATRLERAGHGELAQRALRVGVLQDIMWVEECELAPTEPQPPVQQLPELVWESGDGHGHGLLLFRAREDARGLRVQVVGVSMSYVDSRQQAKVWARQVVLPRATVLDATRQLLALARMKLVAKKSDDEFVSHGMSTGNFHARLRLEFDGKVAMDESFAGYPASDNVAERFRAEAAVRVMRQAMVDAEWQDREPSAEDLDLVEARCKQFDKVVWWVRDRLRAMRQELRKY